MLGAACHTRRPSRTARAGEPWFASKRTASASGRVPFVPSKRVLRARGGQVCRARPAAARRALHLGEQRERAREWQPVRGPTQASGGRLQVAARHVEPCESGEGLGIRGNVAEREAIGVASRSGAPAGELEVAEQRLHVGRALGAAAGGHGEPHRGDGAVHVAVKLAEV